MKRADTTPIAAGFTVEVDPVMRQLLGPALARSIEAKPARRRTKPQNVRAEIETAAPTPLADVPAPEIETEPDAKSDAAPKKRSTMRCKKCGEIGFRSDGCGRTHNVASPPGSKVAPPAPDDDEDDDGDDEDDEPRRVDLKSAASAPVRPGRADRFARIEAAAQRRNGVAR